jgi:prepilin peptidase CpaA
LDLGKQRRVVGDKVIAFALVLVAAAAAAYTDLKRGRIPNGLVFALLICGLAVQATHGWTQFAIALAIFAGVLLAGVPLFSMRIMGGGDVKFMAAAAAALGWPDALVFLLYTLLAGGVLAVGYSIARGRLRSTLAGVGALTMPMLSGARPAASSLRSGTMPYALAILAGAAALTIGNALDLHLRISL